VSNSQTWPTASALGKQATDEDLTGALFIDMLDRFERQDRDISWQKAPRVFAYLSPFKPGNIPAFRAAMETLLDERMIVVERLPEGGNRLAILPTFKPAPPKE
jgi:hypothetical protein